MKKALILGIGESGLSAGEYLYNNGYEIFYYDKKKSHPLYKKVRLKDLKSNSSFYDLVIKSPGIKNTHKVVSLSYLKTFDFINDIELFARVIKKKVRIIAITGSNGKTTLATFIYNILKEFHPSVFLCGNIGLSPLRIIDKIEDNSIIVMELSSFQIELIKSLHPEVAILTNLSSNHLDMVDKDYYYSSKFKLLRLVKKDGYIFSSDFNLLGDYKNLNVNIKNFKIKEGVIYKLDRPFYYSNSFHDFELKHVLTSLKVTSLFYDDDVKLLKAINNLKKVSYRLEKVEVDYPLTFINDAKSSNVDSLRQALKEYESHKRIIIIGGIYKSQGIEDIKLKDEDIVFTYGRDGRKLKKLLNKGEYYNNLEEILIKIKNRTYQDYVVIFSPSCSSFDQFDNYVARGKEFIKLVKEIFHEQG